MRRAPRRALAVLALAGAVAASLLPGAAPTEAAFTDAEHAASAPMSAVRLVSPQVQQITTCARPALTATTFLAVRWRFPATGAPYSGFTSANTRWVFENQVTTGTTTGPDANGVYTTSFSGNLISNLLDSILGGTLDISVTTVYSPSAGNTWRSADDTAITQQIPPLIGSPTCAFENGV